MKTSIITKATQKTCSENTAFWGIRGSLATTILSVSSGLIHAARIRYFRKNPLNAGVIRPVVQAVSDIGVKHCYCKCLWIHTDTHALK